MNFRWRIVLNKYYHLVITDKKLFYVARACTYQFKRQKSSASDGHTSRSIWFPATISGSVCDWSYMYYGK